VETFYPNEIIITFLNHWANYSLYTSNFVVFCGVYLGWILVAFLFYYIYQSHKRWKTFRFILIALFSALMSLFVADLIKTFYPISRPSASLKGIIQIFIPGDRASFPSSHMAFLGGLAFALMWRKRKLGLWFLAAVVLIGLARIAAGIHYPLDILVGLLLGFIVSLVFRRFIKLKYGHRQASSKG